ncbi:hypothetical protein IAU60_006622 [Kwoniella sp. DSM 27419]
MHQPHDPGPSRHDAQPSQPAYSDYSLQPPHLSWPSPLVKEQDHQRPYAPARDVPMTPPRERVENGGTSNSPGSGLRGNRAPAPAALILPGRQDDRYAGLGRGVPVESRRVVTEPTPDSAAFPIPSAMSPERPDPSAIDRRALIGVGELATPRWTASGGSHHARTPSMPFSLDYKQTIPMSGDRQQSGRLASSAVWDRPEASGYTVPRPPPKSPQRDRVASATPFLPTDTFTLGSLANFNFDSSMEGALAASLSMPPGTSYPTTSPLSPNSARARMYARRQERAEANLAAGASTEMQQSNRVNRDQRKTPPSTARHSSHDIIKQFAPKNFAHLPPSPSSASINQFLKGSNSVGNLTNTPPTSASAVQFSKVQRADSQQLKSVPSDPMMDEALRKLDGLGTPGKKNRGRISTGGTSNTSRPGTPPKTKKLSAKQSSSSLKVPGSPLDNWQDMSDDLPAVPQRDQAQRGTSSPGSVAGTPNSRESLPITTTTPSTSDVPKHRRSSGASDLSSPGVMFAESDATGIVVPPVPPIPKGYTSFRQGLNAASFVPVKESQSPMQSPQESVSPSSAPKMTKKWSFSSALNLKIASPQEEASHSPPTSWSEILPSDLPSPGFIRHESSDSHATVSKSQPKRLTPSSIPFFRRTSSSSTQSKAAPEVPKQENRPAPASHSRKSVLGMHLPSMLRGSTSKRGLSQHLNPPANPPVKAEKTLSISAEPGVIPEALRHKAPVDDSVQSSRTSSRSESTVNGHLSRLPVISGSPAKPLIESIRPLPSVTPTKIPRIASRPTGGSPSMPPPPTIPLSFRHKSTTSASMAELSRLPTSEFGVVDGVSARQSTSGAHRAHLLAPMSARQETRKYVRPAEVPVRREPSGPAIPPSRRHLPMPPSTVTAMTLSASAKRASRELRPTKKESKDTLRGSSGTSSPIKPSKSLHAKLVIPSASRMSSSSSVGAPSAGYRKSSLVADSPAMSPAEDEESSADAEMAAYIRRRRQRVAAGKKDDMADVNAFPEDIDPAEELTQRAFISKHLGAMTDFERKEVLDYDSIYYSPLPKVMNRPAQAGGLTHNSGYDDERGDYIVVEGDHICYRYEVVGILGKGSFGQVVQCRDHKTGGSVAIKIIRNKKRFHAQALVEVKILQQLVEWDPEDNHFMVRMTDSFQFRGHLCIVTELLSINLYELIKANQFAGFSTILIRRFTSQMLASLQLMRSHRIVHCDLKPESGIKVIDFGSSCLETEKVPILSKPRGHSGYELRYGDRYVEFRVRKA